jgi:hypothetical protein
MALISVSNNALQNITAVPASIPSGALVLLSTQTASASASISFTSGIDSTYDSYVFKFINIHPETNTSHFSFNGSIDSGSNYNVIKTTTNFRSYHTEDDLTTSLAYEGVFDLAQSTAFQEFGYNTGNNNDDNINGYLQLFNPSSTTYVKHFISTLSYSHTTVATGEINSFTAGYFNITSAINAFQFKFNTGNIDDGIIKMYGVK